MLLFSLLVASFAGLRAEELVSIKLASADIVTITDATLGTGKVLLLDSRKAKIRRVVFDFNQHRERVSLRGGEIECVEVRRGDTRTLYVEQCGLRAFEWGTGPIRIEHLFLRWNELAEIVPVDRSIGLRYLSLSDNKIVRPDLSVLRGLKLEFLNLANNGAAELKGVSSLSSLGGLDLRDNRLVHLPSVVFDIPGLRQVFLQGNPIPSEIAAKLLSAAQVKQIEVEH